MSTAETLSQAPTVGNPSPPDAQGEVRPGADPVTYTAEQLAELMSIISRHQPQPQAAVDVKPLTEEQLTQAMAIPSRPCLEGAFEGQPRYTESDPCPSHEKRCRNYKNPHYNPSMDPGSDRWDAYTYFRAQPQDEVFVHPDPESPDTEMFTMSINGFTLPCYPNKRNRMPRDFVDLLRDRSHSFDVYGSGMVSRDPDASGSLSLSVNGELAKAHSFDRRTVS